MRMRSHPSQNQPKRDRSIVPSNGFVHSVVCSLFVINTTTVGQPGQGKRVTASGYIPHSERAEREVSLFTVVKSVLGHELQPACCCDKTIVTAYVGVNYRNVNGLL